MSRQSGDANAPLVPTCSIVTSGTNIDCVAAALEDGRFRLDLTADDSSVETGPEPGGRGESFVQVLPDERLARPARRPVRAVFDRDGQGQRRRLEGRCDGDGREVDL
jgi:hypothetical protein